MAMSDSDAVNLLGIVAHFKKSPSDRSMEEFSVSSQFKQTTFKALKKAGFDLENVVYYQGTSDNAAPL